MARADGRLFPVDESGTFVRKRSKQGELARPPGISLPFWESCSRSEKLAEIRRAKESSGGASGSVGAAVCYRTFTVALPCRVSSRA